MAWPWFADTALGGSDAECDEKADGWTSGRGLAMTLPYGRNASWVRGWAVTRIASLTWTVKVMVAAEVQRGEVVENRDAAVDGSRPLFIIPSSAAPTRPAQ